MGCSVSIHVVRLTLRAWMLEGGQVGFESTVDEENPTIREPLSLDEKLKESFAIMMSFCREKTKVCRLPIQGFPEHRMERKGLSGIRGRIILPMLNLEMGIAPLRRV